MSMMNIPVYSNGTGSIIENPQTPKVTRRVALGDELGVTGLRKWGRYIYEEFLTDLQGRNAAKVYTEMMSNDAIVGASLVAIEMLIRQVEWRVEPGSTEQQDVDYAKFVDEALHDMSQSWGETLSDILTMLPYGWSWHEIVYKRRNGLWSGSGGKSKFSDGNISWRKFAIRGQNSLNGWVFDENGGVQAMIQLAPGAANEVVIPIEKSLLFRTRPYKNNPEGRSLLRNAYRSWYYKKRIEEIEAVGVERDLAGLPLAYVDPAILYDTASDDEKALKNSILSMMQNVRRDQQEGIMFPRAYDDQGHLLYEFTLTSSTGSRQFDTNTIIQRYDQRIAMTMLTDFILLGHEKVGSFSLSSDKTDVFTTSLAAVLQGIADVINRHAIPRLFKLNGWQPEFLPEIKFEDIETQDLGQLAAYVSSLVGSGMPLFPDPDLEAHLRAAAHLPEKSDEAEQMQQEAQMQMQQQQSGQPQEAGANADLPTGPNDYSNSAYANLTEGGALQ
ncbi:hypothetical protein UFOVP238_5 [uncultured Caudovirales phage]|uniref:Portal protein n=1 Tax=uncultured Caudovirales phage TaxID=2100421 RepID=A0A6J7WU82_9CAUD|nr:hypothetical protein UFOVP238_5 [uncultured Caudovirales phage]